MSANFSDVLMGDDYLQVIHQKCYIVTLSTSDIQFNVYVYVVAFYDSRLLHLFRTLSLQVAWC